MRKKVLSILFAIVLIFALKNMSYAASANISCDSEATVGKEITITANVTGVQWNLDLKVNGQTIAKNSELENYEANKSVSFSGKYTPNAEGTLNISLEGTVTEFSNGTTIRNFGTKTITVKAPENNNSNSDNSANNGNSGNNGNSSSEPAAKSTEAVLSNLGIRPNDFTGFKPNKKEYSVEVPNSTSEVEVYATASKGEIISGLGKVALKEGNNTVEVVVRAEAGNTETYTLKIKRRTAEEEAQNASDATLKNLGINPKEYDFSGFKKDQTEYSVEVPNEIKTVEVYAEATDSKAQVTGTGDIELNEGANEAKVEVIAQDGTKKTYTITITRKASETAATTDSKFGLSSLSISGQTISPNFKNTIYSYTVGIKEDISSLEINAVATDKEAKIEIMGNENLQQGENTIKVIVKNEKTNQTVTYKITVNKNVVSETKVERNFFNPSTWGKEMIIKSIIVAVLILLIIIAVVLKVKISKEAKLENGNDNHDDIDFPGANELNKAIAEHQELSENNEKNEESKAKKYVENDAKTERLFCSRAGTERVDSCAGRRNADRYLSAWDDHPWSGSGSFAHMHQWGVLCLLAAGSHAVGLAVFRRSMVSGRVVWNRNAGPEHLPAGVPLHGADRPAAAFALGRVVYSAFRLGCSGTGAVVVRAAGWAGLSDRACRADGLGAPADGRCCATDPLAACSAVCGVFVLAASCRL